VNNNVLDRNAVRSGRQLLVLIQKVQTAACSKGRCTNATLTGATLTGATLTGATLTGTERGLQDGQFSPFTERFLISTYLCLAQCHCGRTATGHCVLSQCHCGRTTTGHCVLSQCHCTSANVCLFKPTTAGRPSLCSQLDCVMCRANDKCGKLDRHLLRH
jgi:hypothetical protein